jgi:multidrug efflux system outer membrane protein
MKRLAVAVLLLMSAVSAAEPWSLPDLIVRARANDHRVKEAHAQLRWFRSKYEEAQWAWFPRVDSYAMVAGPTPEAQNDGLGGPPTSKATLMYDLDFGTPGVMFRAGAEAVLPLYTFGKLSALEEAGRKGVEAGQALQSRAEDEAELQVAQAYYGYCLAKASAEVIAETLKRVDDARATLLRLRNERSEQVTQLDVYKVDYYRAQIEAQRYAADSGANFALAAIRLLIAAPSDEPIELVVVAFDEPSGSTLPVERYVAAATRSRPEIKAIAAGIGAREQEVLIRERMFYPDFGLAGFFRWMWTTSSTRQRSPFAYDPYNDLSAGVGLVMRYQWDFPQKSVALEQARAELEKMRHQEALIIGGVRLEIEKAWNDTNAAISRAAKLAVAEKNARRWALGAFAAFDLGTGETRELVDSFTALALSSASRAQALYDVQIGLRALARAVGQPVALTASVDPVLPAPALRPGVSLLTPR